MDGRFDPSPPTDFDLDLASIPMNQTSDKGGSEQPVTREPGASAALLAHAKFPGVLSPLSAFGPTSLAGGAAPDIKLSTTDNFHFYAHRNVLQYASTNAFGGLLAGHHDEAIHVPEPSAILAIVLHIVYGLSCLHLPDTTLETVESALNVFPRYGLSVREFAAPTWPLSQVILSHAPHHPIDAYALAAHHQLEGLAVAISAHLLAYNMSSLTDVLSVKMGPVYVKRLFDLQRARRDALKIIVMKPPTMHRPNLVCGSGQQRQLLQVWAFAAAEMAWNVPPTTSTHMLQSTFERAGRDITCGECRAMLNARILEAMEEWSAVRRTI